MKFSYKKVILVGFAFLLIQAFWIAYDAIVPLMLVNKFGMNHTWSGLIMALDNILALFMLPIFGSISDKSKFKMGKRKPFVLVGTLCAAAAFFALSFADYAQVKNFGAQAEMPATYTYTEASVNAHEYYWEENYVIDNNEYSRQSKVNNNAMGEEVSIRNYVANILYGKNYAELNPAQAESCKQWFMRINFTETYVFGLDENGKPEYKVYFYKDANTVVRVIYDEAGVMIEMPAEVKDAKRIGSANVYSVLINSSRAQFAAKLTYKNPVPLVIFMILLLITLIAMSVFRSPAVALMPDVVIKPDRSKGNAIINLMGVVGGVVILALGMVMGTDKVENQIMSYVAYIGSVCVVMLVSLAVFMFTVKEPEWNKQMLEAQAELDARDAEEKRRKAAEKAAAEGAAIGAAEGTAGEKVPDIAQNSTGKLDKGQLASLIFILLSVAFWYMGYNAVYSKYSLYSVNVLGKAYNLVLIAAQVVALAAFFPLGILSEKIGRKKTILFGIILLGGAFLACCFMTRNTPDWVFYVLFSLVGIGWAAINVNSFPMVVEMAHGGDIGKYTGYYYMASMAAQIVTPFLSGIIMDAAGSMDPLFWYGTVFVMLSFVTMLFVKHGDSKPVHKGDGLEYLDVGDD